MISVAPIPIMLLAASVEASAWTGPVILTLCLALLALLVSITALVWQVISWRRSGPRLRVVTKWGIAGEPPNGEWFISLEVSNTGRLATEINQVGFQLTRKDRRRHIVATHGVLGMPITMPITLAPGASTSVMYSPAGLLGALREQGLSGKRARPYADTGHGRTMGRRRRDLGRMAEQLSRPDP